MTSALHVGIVGYGTAGQAAAVMLSRDGHHVQVFERAARPGPVGAGLLLQPTGLQVLWAMGLLPQALAHGAPVRRLYGETDRGHGVMDMRYATLDARTCGLGMQRGALFSILAAALDGQAQIHDGSGIVDLDAQGGFLRDERGARHGPFDLLIAADGSASNLRAHVATPTLDRPYPWGALWCLLDRGDWPWADELRQRYVAARRMIGFLPVGTRPGDDRSRLSFFWSMPTAGFEAWQQGGLPAWHREIAAIWPEALPLVRQITECATLSRASYRDTVLARWHRDRLVLLGDAAHSMSPQLGQGVNMALLDALALRDALRSHGKVPAALAGYQAERQPHVSMYQTWSRWLTPLFQSNLDGAARLRDAAFLPMGRLPLGQGHMLRVLSGTQRGHFGRLQLEPAFLTALEATAMNPGVGQLHTSAASA